MTRIRSWQSGLSDSRNKVPDSISSVHFDLENNDIKLNMKRYKGMISANTPKTMMNTKNVDSTLMDCKKKYFILISEVRFC